ISGATPSGAGMQFDGIDNAVIIGDHVYLPSDLTMEADVVFTPTTDPDYYTVISKSSDNLQRNYGRLIFKYEDGGNKLWFDWWDFDTTYPQYNELSNIDISPTQEWNIIGS